MSSATSVHPPAQTERRDRTKQYKVNNDILKGFTTTAQVEKFWSHQTQTYARELTLAHAMAHDDLAGADPVGVVTRAWHKGAYPIVELFRDSLRQLGYDVNTRAAPSTLAGMTLECFDKQLRKCLVKFNGMRVALSGSALGKCCKYMGDLHRYQADYRICESGKAWGRALDCYRKACMADLHDGKLYHLISLLYRSRSLLLSFYYACRALSVASPFMPSRESALVCFGESEKVLRDRISRLGYPHMDFPDGRIPNWVRFAISSNDETALDVCWQHTCLYMHSMVFTNVGIDKFDKWLKYAYLPLLKARIACPSSAKFGTRIAILDFSAIHQYSRYGTKPFAPIINECQCAMRMLIQTLHLCIQAFIDGFHGTTEAEVSQTRFAVTYISMFLLYVSRAKPRTIERMMYCTLEFRLAQTGTLVSDFVLAMNMLLEAKIAENGTSTESMDGLLMEGLPEDLALQGIRWIKPFCQIDSDISEDALHEGRRQLRLLALAKEVVGAKAIFVSYCAEARGFEIAETLLRQAMAQQEASVAASKKSLESTKRHMPSTGPFSGIAHDCTFVFDTNCFIRGLDEIKEMMSLGWSVVVPVAVLTELRGLMNRKNYELCMSAKDAAQFITSTHRDFGGYGPLQVYTRKGQRVFNLKAKPEINPRGNTMDDTIVETCRSFTPNAALVTNDRNMRIKAAMVYGQDIRIGDLKDIQTYIYPSQ